MSFNVVNEQVVTTEIRISYPADKQVTGWNACEILIALRSKSNKTSYEKQNHTKK